MIDMDATLAGLQQQLEALTAERDEIEQKMAGIQQSIHGLLVFKRRTLGGQAVGPIATASLTDACRSLLKSVAVPLTPIQVKDGLVLSGYDFSGYKSNPLSSIHTVLKRLVDSREVASLVDGNGSPAYQWIHKAPFGRMSLRNRVG